MIRNNENENCPSNDYQQGKASGKCWGDGHYRCLECKHYRADFKKHGLDYVSAAHNPHSSLTITELTNV